MLRGGLGVLAGVTVVACLPAADIAMPQPPGPPEEVIMPQDVLRPAGDARVPGTGVEPMLPPRRPGPGDPSPLAQVLDRGSSAALILFLARNPESPEAPAARAALAARRGPDPVAVTAAEGGADAGVIAAFDAARLAGTAAAWAAFRAAHAGHPLAAEARFWLPPG